MSSHVLHGEILEEGLDMDCARCRDLAEHPGQLDEPNRARLKAGHTYSELDEIAAANIRREELKR